MPSEPPPPPELPPSQEGPAPPPPDPEPPPRDPSLSAHDLPPPSPQSLSPPPDPPTGATVREAPRRLHPFSIIRGIQLRQLLGAIPALFFLGVDPDTPGIVLLVGTFVVFAIIAVVRVLSWQRHTYEFSDGRIVERSGIVSRSERALEVERIQQVDVERTLLDRLVGTCELRLETAADSGDAELRLRVVSVEEARRLRQLLAARIGGTAAATTSGEQQAPALRGDLPSEDFGVLVAEDTAAERAREEVLVKVPLGRVALAAVTGPRLWAVPAGIAVLFGVATEYAATDDIVDTAGSAISRLSIVAGVVLFVVVLVVSVLFAAFTGIVRDGGFTIAQRGDDLRIRRGLTTTRSATVPMRRVQRVTVRRRWLQQALGYASITVHSAGGGGAEGGNELDRSLTVPLLPLADVEPLVHRLLGVAATPALRPHPPAAHRRAIVRGLLGMLGLALPVAATGIAIGRLELVPVALVLLGLGAGSGSLTYDKLASGADAHVVAGRTGLFGTTTELSPLRKTQGTKVRSSYFQRRLGLSTLAVHVAGPAGGIELQDLGELTATRLAPTLYR